MNLQDASDASFQFGHVVADAGLAELAEVTQVLAKLSRVDAGLALDLGRRDRFDAAAPRSIR
jgi:hypothetical protein